MSSLRRSAQVPHRLHNTHDHLRISRGALCCAQILQQRMADGGLQIAAPIHANAFRSLSDGYQAFQSCRCVARLCPPGHSTACGYQRAELIGIVSTQQLLGFESCAAVATSTWLMSGEAVVCTPLRTSCVLPGHSHQGMDCTPCSPVAQLCCAMVATRAVALTHI